MKSEKSTYDQLSRRLFGHEYYDGGDCVTKYSVGVDLGGTKILTILWNSEKRDVVAEHRTPTGAKEGPDAVIGRIVESVRAVADKAGLTVEDVRGIGMGSPGPLNVKTGIVLCPPNLSGWINIPLRDRVRQAFGAPTFLDNDANVAGFAEWKVGAGQGCANMLYVTISTGIGGAAIIDNRLQHGETGSATEFGHVMIDPNGPKCGCGNLGCLEALASGTAIARDANARLALRDRVGRQLTAEDVFALFAEGEPEAVEVVSSAIRYLAIGLANYIHIYNPRVIVVGGGVADVGEALFAPLREQVAKLVFPHLAHSVEIVPAKLGSTAGAVGAALLVDDIHL